MGFEKEKGEVEKRLERGSAFYSRMFPDEFVRGVIHVHNVLGAPKGVGETEGGGWLFPKGC